MDANDENQAQVEEVEELMQRLPKARWLGINDKLIKYQGFWHIKPLLRNIISFQRHFQARDSDLIIASVPKTGNTWLKALLFAIVDRGRAHAQVSNSSALLKNHPHELVCSLEGDVYGEAFDYPRPHHLSQLPSPRLLSTHLSYHSLPESIKTCGSRILYIFRNPLDVYVSLWHFSVSRMNMELGQGNFVLPTMEEYFEQCYQGVTPFGPFFDHVVEYYKLSLEQPNKVLFLKYEDLKKDPEIQLKRLAEFVGLPFSSQEESQGVVKDIIELCSFKNLKELQVNKSGVINKFFEKKSYFRKGEVGDWKQYFTPSMAEKMNRLMEEKFDAAGITL